MQALGDGHFAEREASRARSGTLKYRQLADHFKGLILSGQLGPGSQLPTFAQMSALHGASRPTVERMLLILESENLIERQNGNGIFVAQSKTTVREPRIRQNTIGLSGEGFAVSEYSSYWALLMSGAREAAARAGMQLLMLDDRTGLGWEKADGVLSCDWRTAPLNRPYEGQLPVVSLMTEVQGLCSVGIDDEAAGYDATRYLLELGHSRIGFLHSYPQSPPVQLRLDGYRRALREAGITPTDQWTRLIQGQYLWGSRYTLEARRNMEWWLQNDEWQRQGCTALICQNDEAAMGAIQALGEAGIRVPSDVSVIGFDGTPFCELVTPALSSVALPLREIAAQGIELLLKQIEGEPVETGRRLLPIQIQTRASTAAPLHS